MKINIKTKYLIYAGLIIAFILRVFNLTYEGLWSDELLTAVTSHPRYSTFDIIQIMKGDVHPPLHTILTNLWSKLFVHNDITIRLINVFFGVWGVYAGYLLTKELFNKKVALYAFVLLILNSFLIRYSQEARSYALLTVLATFSFYYFVKLIKDGYFRKYAILYILSSTAMLYTHYFGLLVIASQFVAFFLLIDWKKFKAKALHYIVTFALPNILFLFWLQFLLKRADKKFQTWRDPATPSLIYDYLKIFFNDYVLSSASLVLLGFTILYLTTRKFINYHKKIRDIFKGEHFGLTIVIIWLVTYFFIPFIRSTFTISMMVNRYFVPLVVPVVILLAFYLVKIHNKKLRTGIFTIISIYSILVLFLNTNPYFSYTTTYRETVEKVREMDPEAHVFYLSRDRRYFSHYLQLNHLKNIRNHFGPFKNMILSKTPPDQYFVVTHLRAFVPQYKDSIPVVEGYKEVESITFRNMYNIKSTKLIRYEKIDK
ncbi:glycosyltransferase family 39 protein [Marixanthomonas sp. SCSIO 43207]|uniref:glycosyltransferase family 39 protein n=1 Tax=Marixanthomonas sp. SCSIO 43207 TaxID=2779360 RepID=UPI001CA96745|nr:glycosyltransferase family 39 protein [Marixanthomonas sp. SCSIO 43207]UAB81917.1 glycosyltransferase family 39 protein [Marixanthomonas sp. SCSIO 43207]